MGWISVRNNWTSPSRWSTHHVYIQFFFSFIILRIEDIFFKLYLTENQALILATRQNLAARCDKMKETKREINATKKHNQELKQTLAEYVYLRIIQLTTESIYLCPIHLCPYIYALISCSLRQTKSDNADYIELLKSDTKQFRKKVEAADKDQNQRLEDLEQKWKMYQVKFCPRYDSLICKPRGCRIIFSVIFI